MEIFLTKEDLKSQSIHQLLSRIWTAKASFGGMYICGVDVGWTTDPTEIVLYCYDGKFLHNFLRVHIDQWQLPDQYEAIKYIDSIFPFTAIGIDRAGGGIGLLQDLQRIDDRWNYMTFGFHFGENIITGVSEATGEFISRECKTYGIQLIEQKMKERTIAFPKACLDRENEYVNLTHEVRKLTGQIVYSNYSDHIISADIVGMLALDQYLMKNGFETPDIGVILEPIYFGSERQPVFAGQ